MGRIIMPPRDIEYPYPKAVGTGTSKAKILGRAMKMESFPNWGDYMRILDLVQGEDGNKELRFCQYYRKWGGGDNDWIFGQGAGHMSVDTFHKLIDKAKKNPDYGSFEGLLDTISVNL